MSKRVKENVSLINFLADRTISPSQFKSVISILNKDQLNSLSEIAVNVLYGTIPVSESHKQKLKPFKTRIEVLGKPKGGLNARRELFTKEHRVLKSLLVAALPFVLNILK